MSKLINLEKSDSEDTIRNVLKIKGHLTSKTSPAIVDIGGKPYFKLRKNTRTLSLGYPAWNKMTNHFKHNQKDYLKHYHPRSNVETTYSMFKRKIRGHLTSKTSPAQTNEALCLAIAHNLFVLVNSIFCKNIQIKFHK